MKKIYEDDFVIAVDTENEDTSSPIVVMYSTKVVKTAYDHCLQDLKHDERLSDVILAIIQTGRKNGVYKEKLADSKNFIERWEKSLIERVKETVDEEDLKYFEDKYLESRSIRYEKEIERLEMYDKWDLKKIKSIYLGGLK